MKAYAPLAEPQSAVLKPAEHVVDVGEEPAFPVAHAPRLPPAAVPPLWHPGKYVRMAAGALGLEVQARAPSRRATTAEVSGIRTFVAAHFDDTPGLKLGLQLSNADGILGFEEGALAQQEGTLRVGDRLVAVNGVGIGSGRGTTVSELLAQASLDAAERDAYEKEVRFVLHGRDLALMDRGPFDELPSSDPYYVLHAADPEQPSELRKVARSNTLEGSNPAWPAVVVGISKLRSGGSMRLEAYDSDLGSMQDGLIGQVNFLRRRSRRRSSTRGLPCQSRQRGLAPASGTRRESSGSPPSELRQATWRGFGAASPVLGFRVGRGVCARVR